MDWLNRLDDALDDAVHTSHRIHNRRRRTQQQQQTAEDAEVLAEFVSQHLRPTTTAAAQHNMTNDTSSMSSSLSSSRSIQNTMNIDDKNQPVSLPPTPHGVGTTLLPTKSRPPTKISHKSENEVGIFNSATGPTNNNTATRLSKHSPWGQAIDSIAVPSQEETTPRRENKTKALTRSMHKPPTGMVEMAGQDLMKEKTTTITAFNGQDDVDDGAASEDPSSDINETELKRSSYPEHVLLKSDFDVDHALTSWKEDDKRVAYDPSMNCFGVVHVRVMRAQRLPCPVGSLVHAVVALPPWKGKVRTSKTKAFSNSSGGPIANVCTDWADTENSVVSMVHAYSSEDSPVPSIRVALVFSASALGMLEFEMCHVELPCESLLKHPTEPMSGWFVTTKSLNENVHASEEQRDSPLVHIEAIFEPEESTTVQNRSRDGTEHLSKNETLMDDSSVADDSSIPSTALHEFNEVQQYVISETSSTILSSKKRRPPLKRELSQSDHSTSLSSFRNVDGVVISSSKTHLLRLKVFYVAARCAVCSRSIASGFRKTPAYRCERCGVDCCYDCRLHVDFRLPCGSKSATSAAAQSIQSKLTVDNILRTVAPVPELDDGRNHPPHVRENVPSGPTVRMGLNGLGDGDNNAPRAAVGTLKVNIIKAFVFQSAKHPSSSSNVDKGVSLSALTKKGDYYMRITSSTGQMIRTKTVQQSGRPKFRSGEMSLPVPSYGVEFSLELVDDATDSVIGSGVLPANAILQQQRDSYASSTIIPFVWVFSGPVTFNISRRVVLDLREANKQSAVAFFSDSSDDAVVGTVELDLLLEEDKNALYGPSPYKCPPRSHDQLDLAVLQNHIRRISNLIRDAKKLVEIYKFMVSWENPAITAFCACIYFHLCITSKSKHIVAMPLFALLVIMAYLGFDRAHGRLPRRYINRDLEKLEHEDGLRRPSSCSMGMINIEIVKGSNLKYPEYGLPGSAVCKVSLDLTHLMSEDDRKRSVALDEALGAPHELGFTESVYSSDPIWHKSTESLESSRIRQAFPFEGPIFDHDNSSVNSRFSFPLLQPGRHHGQNISLEPWTASPAAIILEVRFHDLVSILPGTEHILGQVVIPVSKLISQGEIRGWLEVREPGKKDVPFELRSKLPSGGTPQLLVQLSWVPPESFLGSSPNEEKEASVVVHQEMIRAARLFRQQQVSLLGSSIGAFNTVRGLSSTLLSVQNALGTVLDCLEAVLNVFNFSDPYKSSVVFVAILLAWMVLSIIPSRFLMSAAGILQFGITLHARLFQSTRSRKVSHGSNQPEKEKSTSDTPSVATWISNAFMGLPTDEDMRRTYYWDTRRVVALEAESRSAERRNERLSALWKSAWHGNIEFISSEQRRPAFCVLQGHRFLWWNSSDSFDRGEAVLGQLTLDGHAGIATPSPVELRAVKGEEANRIVVIFGRGEGSQERITLLCPDATERQRCEDAVLKAISRKTE